MGRQVNFYITPDDLGDLERTIRSQSNGADVVFVASISHSMKPVVVDGLRMSRMGVERLTLYGVRARDLEKVRMDEVPAQGVWSVDVLLSPVIEIIRCYSDAEIIRRGRIYFQDRFYDESGHQRSKDSSFVAWGETVLRAVRRSLNRLPNGDYASDRASASGLRYVAL